ncbi:MAG: hypothetical protein J6K20_00185 [Thermoguttaceae bacterium]|nr:hypothetical protein [Thermoguttaceae bacterium]
MLEMKKDMMGREIVEANPSEAEEKEVKRKIEELKPAVESAKKERVAWFNLRGSLRKGWEVISVTTIILGKCSWTIFAIVGLSSLHLRFSSVKVTTITGNTT